MIALLESVGRKKLRREEVVINKRSVSCKKLNLKLLFDLTTHLSDHNFSIPNPFNKVSLLPLPAFTAWPVPNVPLCSETDPITDVRGQPREVLVLHGILTGQTDWIGFHGARRSKIASG